MRCFVEKSSILKLRQENIFLCFDGSAWTPLWKKIFAFLNRQIQQFDIQLTLGILSWGKPLECPPESDFLAQNMLANRGRFLTPLVEEIFPTLERKSYNLFILTSQIVYDFEDWNEELQSFFHRIVFLNPDDLVQKTQVALEDFCIQTFLGTHIQMVSISSPNGLFHGLTDWSKGTVSIENETCVFTQTYDASLVDIPLKVYNSGAQATVCIKTDELMGEFSLRTTRPDFLACEFVLNQVDQEFFLAAIENYRKHHFHHYCPLCKVEHGFNSKALLCPRHKSATGGIFASASLVFTDMEHQRKAASRYLFFQHHQHKIEWSFVNESILYIEATKAIVITESGVFSASISDSLSFSPLKMIHKGLFYDEEMKISILVIS